MQEVANQAGAAISGLTGFTDGGFREALILDTALVPALVAYLDGSASHVQYHAAAALIALAGVAQGACRQQVCGPGETRACQTSMRRSNRAAVPECSGVDCEC